MIRLSDLRLTQAAQLGADILAIAWPYSMLMFNGSLVVTGLDESIQVKDISELVLQAL